MVKVTLCLGSKKHATEYQDVIISDQLVFVKGDSMGILKEYITKHNVPKDKLEEEEGKFRGEVTGDVEKGVLHRKKDHEEAAASSADLRMKIAETVALVEDIVVEYVTDMVHKAQDIASKRGKLLTEDFLFFIRKDTPKLNRCTKLLSMNEELKQARKAFDVDEEKRASAE
nr:transcription initiation factor TFIID subunit 13 [Tanacetum cinerariifolium]